MTFVLQQVTVQKAPPPPPRADDLGARIEAAVERALSGATTGQGGAGGGQNTREGIREAVEAMRAEIEAARAQGVERITIQPPFGENMIPPQAVDISVAFFVMLAFVIVGLPLARAFARRMDRRGETASASEIAPRLDRIEQAVEAIAIEVERVSEGQRFTTKAIAELRGLPSANPGGWPAGAREAERVPAGETSRRP
jgi:hypothetical protein